MGNQRDGMRAELSWAIICIALGFHSLIAHVDAGYDYGKALELSLMFYEAQRSGSLPSNQRVTWRSNSGVDDGSAQGVNLNGGYYDAGDNVKFGFPMAFTITTLAWSTVEYRGQLQSQGQLQYAMEAIRWGTDYFIKAHPEPNVLWAEVGDGDSDHACWQRPEDMSTSRQAYSINENNPGSEVAAETAAAMAAASIVFQSSDPSYSNTLLGHAKQLFTFADTYRGKYDSSIPIVQRYYPSFSGYGDELLWAAMWLFMATDDQIYLDYVVNNAQQLGGTGWAVAEFGWDMKYAGVQILASKILLQGHGGEHVSVLQDYQKQAEYFVCAALGKNSGKQIQRSPGGMFWTQTWNNMQYVTSAAFLLTAYSDYLSSAKQDMQCSGQSVQAHELLSLAQSQVNYILGSNPRGTAYMVGYGAHFPNEVHHRAASIVSIKADSAFVGCKEGYADWYNRPGVNPNTILGAIVGGPDQNDDFVDKRDNYVMTEPCTYNNGPVVGVLARLAGLSFQDSKAGVLKPPMASHTIPFPNGDVNSLKLTQQIVQSWTTDGKTVYKYAGVLTNNNSSELKSLTLTIQQLNGQLWGLSEVHGNSFTFPQWIESLAPGQSLTFVYIQSTPMADITVTDCAF